MGGWRFGNPIDGCQAEYLRVPFAMANLCSVPDHLTDEQVLMCPDIMASCRCLSMPLRRASVTFPS